MLDRTNDRRSIFEAKRAEADPVNFPVSEKQQKANKLIIQEQSCCMRFNYGLYKVLRIFYASLMYYFMPFMIIILPLMAEYSSTGVLGRTQSMVEINFEKYSIDGVLGLDQFHNFITETVCLTSVDNEAVLRDQDIIDNM